MLSAGLRPAQCSPQLSRPLSSVVRLPGKVPHMELEVIRTYLLNKPGAIEEIPFGPQALVYKVMGKMFALVAWEETPLRVSLKCDPDRAIELRTVFKGVRGAYHFNKRHWNMVDFDGSVPSAEALAMIDDSYALVVKGLPKAKRDELVRAFGGPS